MILGTPQELGFVRVAALDYVLQPKGPREVWRTPEGVLLALPENCPRIGLIEVVGPRGTTLACVEPPGVVSVWPFKRGKSDVENQA